MITVVKGAGTSSLQIKYTYTDNNASGDVIYFRIRQVDVSGHSQYSTVKAVRINGTMTLSLNWLTRQGLLNTIKYHLPSTFLRIL